MPLQDNFEKAASLFIGEEQLKGVFLFFLLLLRAFLSCDRSSDIKKGLKIALFIIVLEFVSIVVLCYTCPVERSNSAHSKLPSSISPSTSSPSSASFSADPTAASSSFLRSLNPDEGERGGLVSAAPIPLRLPPPPPPPPTSSLPFHGQLLWPKGGSREGKSRARGRSKRRLRLTERQTDRERANSAN